MTRNKGAIRKGEIRNPAGRVPLRLDERALALVEELAAKGCHDVTIAHHAGVAPDTFKRMLVRDRRVANALARGRGQMHDVLVDALMRQKERGPVPSIFLLKARFNYRDQGDPDGESRPTVVINLPGAAPLADYRARR